MTTHVLHGPAVTRIKAVTLGLFALPNMPLAIMHMPVYLVLPAYYSKHTQIGLAAIGTILLVGRLFDALMDPVVGFLSDRTETRIGNRKPWILASLPIAAVAVVFLFIPPADAGATYFLVWSVAMFFAWTLIDIPYVAWATELSRDYNERSRIMTVRVTMGVAGSLLFMASPILLSPWTGSTAIGPEVLTISAWVIAVSLPVLMVAATIFVPAGPRVAVQPTSARSLLLAFRLNKPLRLYATVFLLFTTVNAAWNATALLFFDSKGLEKHFPLLLITAWITRICVAPVWLRLLYRFGKHRIWAAGCVLSACITPLALLVPPGESALPLMLVYAFVLGFVETASLVAPTAILGDVVDYDTLRTGADQAGSYFALNGLMTKIAAAAGGAIAFWVLSLVHYNVKGGNSGHQLLGLYLSFAILPSIGYFISGLAIRRFPIDARRQGVIRRRVESRVRRQALAAAPSPGANPA